MNAAPCPYGPPKRFPTANYLFFSNEPFAPERLEELEKAFFWNLILKNRTHKTTYHHRLDDLNALVAAHLPAHRPLEIMDVAVSSGVSTAEWVHSLQEGGIEHHMLAGDLLVYAWLVRVGRNTRVLVDRSGYPLQLDIAGRAIRTPLRKRDWLRHGPAILAINRILRRITPQLREMRPDRFLEAPLTLRGVSCRAVELVSRTLRSCAQVQLVEDDILNDHRYAGRFHVVRAANILSRVYFDDAVLAGMLRNLRSRLAPGGLLIVCRTMDDGVSHASLFSLRAAGRLGVVARLNEGSEIENLALGLPRTADTAAYSDRADGSCRR
jgi:hypothetical protein